MIRSALLAALIAMTLTACGEKPAEEMPAAPEEMSTTETEEIPAAVEETVEVAPEEAVVEEAPVEAPAAEEEVPAQ